jgi:hypothetical protein
MWFGLLLDAHTTKKSRNRQTNGYTPTYVS